MLFRSRPIIVHVWVALQKSRRIRPARWTGKARLTEPASVSLQRLAAKPSLAPFMSLLTYQQGGYPKDVAYTSLEVPHLLPDQGARIYTTIKISTAARTHRNASITTSARTSENNCLGAEEGSCGR